MNRQGKAAGGKPAAGGQVSDAVRVTHFYDTTSYRRRQAAIRAAGRVVGRVVGDAFIKTVKQNHQLRTPPAWALDVQSLADAECAGARRVVLRQTDAGIIWSASIALIRDKGFVFDRGFGRQVGLVLDYWTCVDPNAPVQLSLFGEPGL